MCFSPIRIVVLISMYSQGGLSALPPPSATIRNPSLSNETRSANADQQLLIALNGQPHTGSWRSPPVWLLRRDRISLSCNIISRCPDACSRMVDVLTTGAVKQREVTAPITTAAALNSLLRPDSRPPSGGRHLPLGGIYQRWQPCAAIPSPDGLRRSMSRVISFNCQSAHPRLHVRGHHRGRRGAKASGLGLISVSRHTADRRDKRVSPDSR